tara:strand:- start:873 stop:1643 length:771 start_codon:yes stop_codon:yes gene_type:complete
MFRVGVIVLILSAALSLHAQSGGELHVFTDKAGKEITAVLLDLSEDRQLMNIQFEDGREFESPIIQLSLDDQQYIKDWLKTRVVEVKTDYRLEIEIDKKALETERHENDDGYYSYEQRFTAYEVTARNLSRETLEAAKLEYVVIWEEGLRVYQSSDGGWSSSYSSSEEDRRVRVSGVGNLGEMPFNRDALVTTDTFEVNRMLSSGQVYKEDEPIGILVRVVNPDGVVLAESRSGTGSIDAIQWDDAIALKEAPKEE